jgi:hypothetical protein
VPRAGAPYLLGDAGGVGNVTVHAVEHPVANRVALFFGHHGAGALVQRDRLERQLEQRIFHHIELRCVPGLEPGEVKDAALEVFERQARPPELIAADNHVGRDHDMPGWHPIADGYLVLISEA